MSDNNTHPQQFHEEEGIKTKEHRLVYDPPRSFYADWTIMAEFKMQRTMYTVSNINFSVIRQLFTSFSPEAQRAIIDGDTKAVPRLFGAEIDNTEEPTQ